jgi:hypothetical protein
MEADHGTDEDPGRIPHVPHVPRAPAEHPHEYQPIERDYRLVVRTVLWVIVALVLAGFVIWWRLT